MLRSESGECAIVLQCAITGSRVWDDRSAGVECGMRKAVCESEFMAGVRESDTAYFTLCTVCVVQGKCAIYNSYIMNCVL